ncbi:MAG: hypothetical protein RL028_33 [Actinomycetota bacterium]|jgi:hypothetical protein
MKKLVALTLLSALLAGCAQLPTKVDIKSGPELIAPEAADFSYYVPTGPAAGASSQEIVSGFLAAGTGPQNDYSVAREFLTDEFAQRWNPAGEVLIRDGAPGYTANGENALLVDVRVSASVDEHGRYQENQEPEQIQLRFTLERQAGEWRISGAPNLTVVTSPVFSVVFNAFQVFFFNNTENALVSDLRWFPSRASTGTKLVNAMLAGPSAHLALGVTSTIPAGTKLTIDAVNVVDGVAQVDFDSTALEADALDRRLMLTQLRATLMQLVGVNDVQISINSSPQEIVPANLQTASVGGAAFYLKNTGIYRVTGTSDNVIRGTAGFINAESLTIFDIKDDGDWLAYATSTGVTLVDNTGLSGKSEQVSKQSNLSNLFFDSEGYLWVVPTAGSEPIEIIATSGERKYLFDNSQTTRSKFRPSPAGARIATLDTTSEFNRVQTYSVLRDLAGWPIRLTPGGVVHPSIGIVRSFTWQSADTLRVLEETNSGLTSISDYPITGPRSQLSIPPVTGVEIFTGTAGLSTYLFAENGEVWVLTGSAWRRVVSDALLVATND